MTVKILKEGISPLHLLSVIGRGPDGLLIKGLVLRVRYVTVDLTKEGRTILGGHP